MYIKQEGKNKNFKSKLRTALSYHKILNTYSTSARCDAAFTVKVIV